MSDIPKTAGAAAPDVRPEDSASNCGRSITSSVTSSRARRDAAAKKAALMAQAQLLQEQQALELQTLQLQQRMAELKLKSQIASAEAEEKVYRASEDKSGLPDNLPSGIQSANDDTLPYPRPDTSESMMKIIHEGQQQQRRLIESVTLPQADLMKYDGNPLRYWEFWRAFENSVDKTAVDDSAKLTRLFHFCTGEAHKLLQACMVMDPTVGYKKAKQMLKERFGNPYKIADAWIQRVTQATKIEPNNKKALQDLADELHICIQTLDAMGYKSELSPQNVILRIVERLPFFLRDRWLKVVANIRKQNRLPQIEDLLSFIQETSAQQNDPVYGRLTDLKPGSKDQSKSYPKKTWDKKVSKTQGRSSYSTSSSPVPVNVKPCLICQEKHTLFGCDRFKKMPPEKRLQFAKEKRLCFNCLRPGHMLSACNLNRTCSVEGCGRKHTKFLHQTKKAPSRAPDNQVEDPPQNQEGQLTSDGASNGYVDSDATGAGKRSVLPIVPVRVQSDGKNFIQTYALLDTGSTHSFCTEALAHHLGARGRSHQLRLTTMVKRDDHIDTSVVSLVVDSGPSTDRIYLPHVCTRKRLNIQNSHMACREDIINLPYLKGIDIPLAGEHEVGLLIGQDTPRALIPLEVRKGDKGPYAVRTALGWSLHGPIASRGRCDASTNFIQGDTSLDEQVQKFWKLEDENSLFDDERGMSFNDRKAVNIWEDTITLDNGHYQLAIPFKERPPSLQDNRCIAEHRLQTLGRRLERDTHLHEKYKEGISDLLQKGYAEEVSESDDQDQAVTWYIPHHPVFHPMKPGKVRIVFDCASKYKGQSLNDVVLQGPDLTNKLIGVLLRFRQERIAIIADIEAMFHQVRVPPEDRDVLRFLWWPGGNLEETPKAFRMCVHLFGGTWSPSCCNFAMRRTAEDNHGQCTSDAAKVVQRNFYVDDCLVSLQDEEKAVKLATELRMLLQKGGFRLAKWLSNNPRVLQTIPLEDRAKQVAGLDLNHEALPVERALGMRWDIEQDCFTYKINPKDKPSTRRGLLSVVSSVYDPLGYASPCVLQAKMILQELTRQKLYWDEPIPVEEAQKWKSWLDELPEMEEFEVNRCVKPHNFGKVTDYQLHNFADASEVAYGAMTYLMMTSEDGQVHCSLLMAKTRLAPLKKSTIPRLELMAATLATRMDTMIRRELDFPITKSTFWTDSMIVLNYIQNKDKRFHTFVSNRLAIIHNATEMDQWYHIDSTLNPADILSRGMPASQLKESSRWLNGPEFLQLPQEFWPTFPNEKQGIDDDDPEVKRTKGMHNFASSCDHEDCIDKLITHFSDWTRLRRAIAWWLRLKKVLQEKVKKTTPIQDRGKTLSAKEIEGAEKVIFQYVQSHAFSEELSVIRDSGNSVPKVTKGSRLYKLDAVYQDGLLRVGGRLRHAMIPSEAKHQVILPKKHHVTSLLVRHTHHRVGHQGLNHVLAEIRQRYWILGAGVVVRSMLKKCVNCRKYQARLGKQKMSDLPSFRLEATKPAFTNVGMDYFGPFDIKCGRSTRKRYGVVFTCMTSRAIHIEVAESLETSSCIDAIRRMISRRGPIKKLFSDNGTNLVGAQAELKRALKEWNEDEILHFTANQGIEWTFNPPTASHQGGVWERQIRTIRKILHAILTEQYLRTCQSEEQLHTLMCEVEAIINSRPLTRVSDDPDDLEVLTPNSLLLMKQVTAPPPGRFTGTDVYARKRWRQMQHLSDLFWKRWLREYLPALQQRQRWQQPERNLQIGDVVLIADEMAPRCSWLMGRVLETHPDKQGYVRSVKVKTATSTFIRPVTKLCLLLEQEI
ncbi:uncharacterized protein LOC121407938 [Lytechinus variegatus]|uniref:uncharacterized protein LOC121407938 n=1 Tax=Lytechinus variegatus TaxID=7654 RepID=UPI001BB19A0A|nr:uncharacterized protein LOC121407938 [Lytechinus variegatus]